MVRGRNEEVKEREKRGGPHHDRNGKAVESL
jgi:hypothetical protein